MDVERLRAETPGCREGIHLNSAGAGLMPAPVLRAIQEHLELEARIGGYEAEASMADALLAAYQAVATLLATRLRNVAFTENATVSFAQALSSIPFERGDVLLTTRNDYASNQIQFLSLQQRLGLRVLRAPDSPAGGVDVAAMESLVKEHRPRLVCVTHIPTNSGLVQDVAAVGRVCREHEALYLVDACQSVGQVPIDVDAIGCDFLSASSRKFLRGPRGAGFPFVSDRVLDRGPQLCGIVTVWIEGHDPAELVSALRERGIRTSAQIRVYATLDFDDKQVPGGLRLSPHYINTESEIDRAVAALASLIAR